MFSILFEDLSDWRTHSHKSDEKEAWAPFMQVGNSINQAENKIYEWSLCILFTKWNILAQMSSNIAYHLHKLRILAPLVDITSP